MRRRRNESMMWLWELLLVVIILVGVIGMARFSMTSEFEYVYGFEIPATLAERDAMQAKVENRICSLHADLAEIKAKVWHESDTVVTQSQACQQSISLQQQYKTNYKEWLHKRELYQAALRASTHAGYNIDLSLLDDKK